MVSGMWSIRIRRRSRSWASSFWILANGARIDRLTVRFTSVIASPIVAAEDHSFFSHHGVNFYRIVASGLHDLFRSDEIMQGGSTLTMQLARNIFGLSNHR